MAFDPITSLSIAVLALLALGVLMVQLSRGEEACRMMRWTGWAFLCLGAGFAMVLAAPSDIRAPVRVTGNAAVMLTYGLLWKATRSFAHRSSPFEIVTAGALAWLLAAAALDPPLAWRIGLTSAIVSAYSFATAWEHRRAAPPLHAQRQASWIFAAHGAFFALRAVLGPTFGFLPWGADLAQAWGAVLGVETVTMAVLMCAATINVSRERSASRHRREALEDVLTGIGNRRALFRSGTELIEAARRRGRPAALLLMDLDGFKAVNDRHGHAAGDRLLKAFACLAHHYLPPAGLVCRLGGEEFAAVLPGADPERARSVADEIRALFAHLLVDGSPGGVGTTVSIGVAASAAGGAGAADMADLLGRADLCLYAAKRAGRDRVVVEGDPGADDLRRPAA